METARSTSIVDVVARIQRSMEEYEGNDRCLVAPSPELRDQLKQELSDLRTRASGHFTNILRMREHRRPGFNDGLIYPGEMFPVGTPVQIVRNAAAERAPLRGQLHVVVVLAEFDDKAMGQNKQHYEDLFFSSGVMPNGSVKEYFHEATNGLIEIVGEVVGPYKLPRTLSEYANGESGTGLAQPNARTMARDAAEAANPDVNYAIYDNDGDGFVDAFIVVHAGPGAEVTGSADDIWSHKWVLSGGPYNADGTRIFGYLTVPDDARIGVCCHELGHLLFGFPDLYDIDYSSEGVGNWCLMGGGSWNGNGEIPAHPSAWCKADQGWVSVINQTTNARVNIEDVKAGHTVYRLWKDGAAGNEYFLLENRQKTLYDRELPGEGLLIWHIDSSIDDNSNESHPKVALVQADGNEDLQNGNNRGDAGDPYPGSTNNQAFNAASTPSSRSYAGTNTCIAVTIRTSGAVVTADLEVKCTTKAVIKDAKDRKDKLEKEKERKEKFEIEGKNIVKDFKDQKDVKEKDFEGKGVTDGGFGQPPLSGGSSGDLEARVAALEMRVASFEPFIDASLRPDLSQSALAQEEDLSELQLQMRQGAAQAKRLYDTPPSR